MISKPDIPPRKSFAKAADADREYLLALDPERLLAPFLREAVLEPPFKITASANAATGKWEDIMSRTRSIGVRGFRTESIPAGPVRPTVPMVEIPQRAERRTHWNRAIRQLKPAIPAPFINPGPAKMALDQPNLFRVVMARPSPPSTAFPQIEFVLSALAAAADFIFNPDPDRQFEQGLELILRGIEADARSIRAGGNAVKKPHSR